MRDILPCEGQLVAPDHELGGTAPAGRSSPRGSFPINPGPGQRARPGHGAMPPHPLIPSSVSPLLDAGPHNEGGRARDVSLSSVGRAAFEWSVRTLTPNGAFERASDAACLGGVCRVRDRVTPPLTTA